MIVPEWPAPTRVRALQTTRAGGFSQGKYASLNLADHVGDEPAHVLENRRLVGRLMPGEPLWLRQVHGVAVAEAGRDVAGIEADAALARHPGLVCVVMTADCLPILLCNREGTQVAAIHAGWRSLCAGVIERCLDVMALPGETLLAWLGPAIGIRAFEVGDEVRQAFVAADAQAERAFLSDGRGKWRADLYALARQRLTRRGVHAVYGGGGCTFEDEARFFSFRRDGDTGRMGSFIWLDAQG